VDELDNPTGIAVAKLAEQKGVTLVAYDRAIFQGSKTYYGGLGPGGQDGRLRRDQHGQGHLRARRRECLLRGRDLMIS